MGYPKESARTGCRGEAAAGSGEGARSSRLTAVVSANSSWNLVNFRKPIIRALVRAGWRVVAVAPADEASSELERLGVEVEPLDMDARGVSPAEDIRLLLAYRRILRKLAPSVFLGFTIKPNIYGSVAAAWAGIPVINTVSGLGTGFLSGRLFETFVSSLYRFGLRRSHRVFFHNREDRDLFVSRGIVRREQSAVVSGSGVNLEDFAPSAHQAARGAPVFLFIGRCLKDKGLEEFVAAAAAVKSRTGAKFQVIGAVEDHPKAVSRELLDQAANAGHIELLGQTNDVRPFIAASDCVVLPSYREGLPRVLLEAAAMGKPVIATDVAGCRDAVEDSSTGLLCEARSASALIRAIEDFIQLPPEQWEAMGKRAREKAVREFSEDGVSRDYMDAIEQVTARTTGRACSIEEFAF